MNHAERIEACKEVSQRLLEKHHDDIIATAVLGSVARRENLEYSDIDFQVLVRSGSTLMSHSFVLNDCLFSVNVRTKAEWKRELTEETDHLPLTIGSLMTVLPVHDPAGAFSILKNLALNAPEQAWKDGARKCISSIFEDLGRIRNFYSHKNWDSFRLTTGFIAPTMALTYANLKHQVLYSEKELTKVFDILGDSQRQVGRAFRIIAGLDPANNEDVMKSLEYLNDFLIQEATKESAMPLLLGSSRDYIAP